MTTQLLLIDPASGIVNADTNITLYFNGDISWGSGNFKILDASGKVVAEFAPTSPYVNYNWAYHSVMIDPPDNLAYGQKYKFVMPDGWLLSTGGMEAISGKTVEITVEDKPVPLVLNGTAGDDVLVGGHLDDKLYGGDGNDKLDGRDGNDVLYGGAGNDTLQGDSNDLLDGGSGDDTLLGSGNARLFGGAGNDTLTAAYDATGVDVDGGTGDDKIDVYSSSNVVAGAGNDAIEMWAIFTWITNCGKLEGNDGNDRFVVHGIGSVEATGGNGSDIFELEGPMSGDAKYVITDFMTGLGGDQLDISRMLRWSSAGQEGNPFGQGGSLRLEQRGADTVVVYNYIAYGSTTVTPFVAVTLKDVQAGSLGPDNIVGGYAPSGVVEGKTLTGTAGSDWLTGGVGDDRLYGEDGADNLQGSDGNDYLEGGKEGSTDGNDTLSGGAGNDTLAGGPGNDTLNGDAGDDVLEGGSGEDDISDSQGSNTIRGGAGNDWIHNLGIGKAIVDGGEGDDTIEGAYGDATLVGGDGQDSISVTGGVLASKRTVNVQGGAGDDRIEFWINDNDAIDVLASGGEGKDSFVFKLPYAPKSGGLVISDFTPGSGDKLDFTEIVGRYATGNPFTRLGYLKLVQSGADTVVYVDGDGAAGNYRSMVAAVTLKGVSAADLTSADFIAGYDPKGSDTGTTLTGTAGADELRGGALDDTLDGAAGNDQLFGGAGNDKLLGGPGDDKLWGQGGDDILEGGAGNDELGDAEGSNVLDGGDGNDNVTGTGTLRGGAGNDIVGGGFSGGQHVLEGGSGDDTLRMWNTKYSDTDWAANATMDGGDGNDRFELLTSFASSVVSARGGAGSDTYVIGQTMEAALTIEDFVAGAAGDVLDVSNLLRWGYGLEVNPFGEKAYMRLQQSGNDTLLQFDSDGAGGPAAFRTIAVLRNVVAASLTAANFNAGVKPDGSPGGLDLQGTQGNDDLAGGAQDDVIRGLAGDDIIKGNGAEDHLFGDAGNDTLDGGDGSDVLEGGDGDDKLTDSAGASNRLDGGAGNDELILSTSGSMSGGDGDDRLAVGISYDGISKITATGGAGRDVFDLGYMRSYETLTITDFTPGAGGDTIDMRTMVGWGPYSTANPFGTSLRMSQVGADTLIEFRAKGVDGNFGDFKPLLRLLGVQAAQLGWESFAGGLSPDGSSRLGPRFGSERSESLHGTGLDDTLDSKGGYDSLFGYAGADTLRGGDGNDWLDGGSGDDFLDGGAGRDTAVWDPGTIIKYQRSGDTVTVTSSAGVDTLVGIERLKVGNQVVAFDLDGNAGQMYRLYQAALGRTPDAGGLGFWIAQADKGIDILGIAQGFIESSEFTRAVGQMPPNRDVVTFFYQNVLHREPDRAGLDYWTNALDKKIATLPEVLFGFSDSGENKAAVAALIGQSFTYTEWTG